MKSIKIFHNRIFQYPYYIYCISIIVFSLFSTSGKTVTTRNLYGLPHINYFSPIQYKGGSEVWDIIQTSNLNYLFATNKGIFEYNGAEWSAINTNDRIQRSICDLDTTILIGSQGEIGYLNTNITGQYEYEKVKFHGKESKFDDVWNLFTIDSSIFICTLEGLFALTNNNKISKIQTEGEHVFTFLINRKIITFIKDEGVFEIDVNSNIRKLNIKLDNKLTGVIAHKNGFIFSTYNNGLFFFDGYSVNIFNKNINAILNGKVINLIREINGGLISIGTQESGLFIFNKEGELLYTFDYTSGLKSNSIKSIYEDIHYNIWVGTENGIHQILFSLPYQFINNNELVRGKGTCLLSERNYTYVGTSNGLFYRDNNNQNFTFIKGTSGHVYNIQNIAGDILVSHHNGVFLLKNSIAKKISNHKVIWGFNEIKENPLHLICGSYNGFLIFYKQNGNWVEKYLDGFSESSRLYHIIDNQIIVVHPYKGLYNITIDYESMEITNVEKMNTCLGDKLMNYNPLLFNIHNEPYLSTDTILFQYSRKTKSFQPKLNNLWKIKEPIHSIKVDYEKNIYYLTNNKIKVLRRLSPTKYEDISDLLSPINSYISDGFKAIYLLDESIVVTANNGFILLDRQNILNYSSYKSIPAEIDYLTAVSTKTKDAKIYRLRTGREIKDIEFEPDFNNLQIHLSYSEPILNGLLIRYKKKGQDWSKWQIERSINLTNLKPGNYKIDVQTKLLDQIPSEIRSIQFKIKNDFIKSLLFKFIILTFLISISFLLYIRKTKRKQNSILQSFVEETIDKSTILKTLQREKNDQLSKASELELSSKISQQLSILDILDLFESKFKNIGSKSFDINDLNDLNKFLRKIKSRVLEKNYLNEQINTKLQFIEKLKKKFTNLNQSEINLCVLIRLEFSTKDIATLLKISPRGVEMARYRLRQKLKLQAFSNIKDFLQSF